MDRTRVKTILAQIASAKIAIYGDFCIDAYWILNPQGGEVSIETGLQAETIDRHAYSPGGAANIAANAAALEPAYIMTIGVIGDDIFGREMLRQLQRLGIDTQGMIVQEHDFDTYTYCKQYTHDKEKPRVDFGYHNTRSRETDDVLIEYLEKALTQCQVLIFNQQIEGSIPNNRFLEQAEELFAAYPETIVLFDSRHYHDRLHNVHRKVNAAEAARLQGMHVKPDDGIPLHKTKEHAQQLFAHTRKPVFVTCGADGLLVADSKGTHHIPGIQVMKKIDPVGAGDTSISALAACLAIGIEPVDAAKVANIAAAVTIQKLLQTGTASGAEICALAEDLNYVYHPELADDIRAAKHIPGTHIEVCSSPAHPEPGTIEHVVFDHDGTISTLREGWHAIMEEMMVKAILGHQYDSVEMPVYQSILEHVRTYIDASTGIQTILQMEAFVQMVKEFGFVPEREILDKFQYKALYNEQLLNMVNQRIESLNQPYFDASDYTLKGAVDFLVKLSERGMTLYLASGTDLEDTQREAEILGYAHYFNGGIYGSVGDVTKFSKKLLLKKILRENNLSGSNLAVIGDGPVEIRECRKRGGLAIGIASDEVRRYGLNVGKRRRLIRAGSDIVIPDFSQHRELLACRQFPLPKEALMEGTRYDT
ncbi:MAG: HAD family hydrolase [bacterium]|nr:HAD family hydrolase [bacterium]